MAKRKVIWSKTAYLQRKKILLYWVERNKSTLYSKKLLQQVNEATQLISEFSEIGKKTDINEVRCFVMHHYSLFYTENNFEIQIVCFWDNRQDPQVLAMLLST